MPCSSGSDDDMAEHLLDGSDGGDCGGGDADGHGDGKAGTELPCRVAQWYYKHGLFLSSYPMCATSIAIFVVLLSW